MSSNPNPTPFSPRGEGGPASAGSDEGAPPTAAPPHPAGYAGNLLPRGRRQAALAIVAALTLAACSEQPAQQAQTPPPATAPPTAPPTPQPPSYVGRWAVSLAACQNGAWEFAKDRVGTAGEVSCQFDKVTPNPSGYAIEAQCVAQAPPELQSFTLAFTGVGPAETMTITGGPWSGPITLVRCPP